MRILATAAIGLVISASYATAAQDEAPSELLAMVGRADFVEHCAPCHGLAGKGNGPVASSLDKPPADLTGIAERRGGTFPAGDIGAFIDGRTEVPAHGTREMPVWGRKFAARMGTDPIGDELVRGRLLILVEYIRTIQR